MSVTIVPSKPAQYMAGLPDIWLRLGGDEKKPLRAKHVFA
jgi:hypothetical protein